MQVGYVTITVTSYLSIETSMIHSLINKLTYMCTQKNISELLSESIGVTVLSCSNTLTGKESSELRDIFLSEKSVGMVMSPDVGDVYQDFYQKQTFMNKECIEILAHHIEKIIRKEVYEKNTIVPAVPINFSSIILQHYPFINSLRPFAISPHVDHKGFVELVVILLIEGDSLFYTADDKTCKNEQLHIAKPFDLIVMRGYQFNGIEKRPVHYVKKIKEGSKRTTLSFRILSNNKEHLRTLKETFLVA